MDWDFHAIKLGAQQGWQCPVCGKVNAPWMMQCTCDGKTSYKINYTREITSTGSQIIYNNRTVITSSSQPEDNCEDCLGGCDLCYECKKNSYKY